MGCPHYEIGVLTPKDKMILRNWSSSDMLDEKNIKWLRYQNANGCHIYIRPVAPHDLNLIDDLNAAQVATLKKVYPPCVVVETSPGNYQVWVKHQKIQEPPVSTQSAQLLAARFGGDPSSADYRHFGRLAGFTNCKAKYKQPSGFFPFCKLIEATNIACNTQEILIEAHLRIVANDIKHTKIKTGTKKPLLRKTIEDFRADPRYAGDYHRGDIAYCLYALQRGMTTAELKAILAQRDLAKKGDAPRQVDYIERTVKKAFDEINKS